MVLQFEGASCLRQRLVCATLSFRAISIKNIRTKTQNPGLKEYEVSFLKLLEKISNGCKIEINTTGTCVYYKPGIVTGGKIEHDCGTERGIGYFLEGLICIAPFSKAPVNALLKGITNHSDNLDISVDTAHHVTLNNLKHFAIEEASIKVLKRGAPPKGGGAVRFVCSIVKTLKPIRLIDDGKIRRIRGVAYTARVSGHVSNRIIQKSREILGEYCPDIYIYADINGEKDGGNSPGYGLMLVAETTTGCFLSYEMMAQSRQVPEEFVEQVTNFFMMELLRRGCVDSTNQGTMVFLMALAPDVSTIRLGKLSQWTIQFLRHIKQFFGVTFKIEPDPESKTSILTCLGTGYTNLGKKTF
ncbi:probable RNA 3'-terminal phosphate cyclase-like protein [Schistocerca gregaria]|uniref:probable RNA 3'-terminal phosphate cyclase-like protein n=1 Tax=Schistocerca gregaria TaxID=7010 RepID=UPI00211EE351|nr:probable RNA 3'-terminal phosphate cyclase-like protein [Schistocerca gregaria]